jgi:hypothetical protein
VIVDNTRPALKVTKAPKSGAKVSGPVKITASATDRNGVNRVELVINGKVVARDVKAGYSFAIKAKKYGKKSGSSYGRTTAPATSPPRPPAPGIARHLCGLGLAGAGGDGPAPESTHAVGPSPGGRP